MGRRPAGVRPGEVRRTARLHPRPRHAGARLGADPPRPAGGGAARGPGRGRAGEPRRPHLAARGGEAGPADRRLGPAARHARRELPARRARGPVVAVANEFSGSDGDIVNAAIKALGIGPVVGTRTWGGVIGIDSRYRLVDGTLVTQPKYAFWLEGYGWDVENHGVDPDVEVVQRPQDHAAGRDVQLDGRCGWRSRRWRRPRRRRRRAVVTAGGRHDGPRAGR